MQPQGQNDYKALLTEVIKKQIVILGPDITLVKARNVAGLTVADDGTVTAISGEPQQITQSLIDQFVQLSGLIVKKTMEPLLTYHADEAQAAASPAPAPTTQPVQPAPIPQPAVMPTAPAEQPTQPVTQAATTPTVSMQPTPSVPQPATDTVQPSPTDQIDAETQKIIDEALKQSA